MLFSTRYLDVYSTWPAILKLCNICWEDTETIWNLSMSAFPSVRYRQSMLNLTFLAVENNNISKKISQNLSRPAYSNCVQSKWHESGSNQTDFDIPEYSQRIKFLRYIWPCVMCIATVSQWKQKEDIKLCFIIFIPTIFPHFKSYLWVLPSSSQNYLIPHGGHGLH